MLYKDHIHLHHLKRPWFTNENWERAFSKYYWWRKGDDDVICAKIIQIRKDIAYCEKRLKRKMKPEFKKAWKLRKKNLEAEWFMMTSLQNSLV